MIKTMEVTIKETGKVETLKIIGINGIDFTNDFVGNYGALGNGQFEYSDETNTYHADQATYDFWAAVVNEHQTLAERIEELEEIHGSSLVQEVVGNASECDLESRAGSINAALDEKFGNHE